MPKNYTTKTEKAQEVFNEGLDSLGTQRERREVLEQATTLIPEKVAPNTGSTINGIHISELEKQAPEVVKSQPFGKGKL